MKNLRDDAGDAKTGEQVVYHSFLLRLRLVLHKGDQTQQIYLKDIHTQAEFYFSDPQDLVRFLDQFSHP